MSREPGRQTESPRRWTGPRLLHLFLAVGFAVLLVVELTTTSGQGRPDWRHVLGLDGAGFFLALAGVLGPRRWRGFLALLAASAACFLLGYFVLAR